ncbi:MAG: hypothetical protein CMN73_04205 [Sphingomonas sp.]|nr:hypothetical protein [Sphingomonas sp.]
MQALQMVVKVQSSLIHELIRYHAAFDPAEKPVLLNDDEYDELIEGTLGQLPAELVREYFPFAPQHLRNGQKN